MRSLGIDIGRYSIKVVEVIANKRKYEITNAKEYKILNVESSDQEIDILQTLNTISKDFDTDNAKVTCSIRQQYVSTRKLFFPFKERAKIHKSLAFELEDDIPLSIEKAICDSKIIKFHEKSSEVVAMACLSEEIEKTLEIFERGHIDPDIITPEFCAIANLYEDWDHIPEEAQKETQSIDESIDEKTQIQTSDKLVVHIGHSKTFVGVVSKGYLVWGRSIMWGAEIVAQEMAKAFEVPLSAALDMMPAKAFVLISSAGASKEQLKMSEAVAKALDPLVQSLRLTIMLANTEYGANVQNIELIGAPSSIKNVGAFLTQELERPTNVVNPVANPSKNEIKNSAKLNVSFQMALGLSIEGLRRPFNPPVNFRQHDFAKKNLSFEKFWEKWSYTAKIITAAYICFFIYGVAIDSISTQLEIASDDVLRNQAKIIVGGKGSVNQRQIRNFIKRNRKKAKLVKVYDQLGELNSPLKFINEVSQILPSNKSKKEYEIRRFMVKDTEVDIQGVADSAKTVTQINKALKGVALQGKVSTVRATIPNEENKKSFAFKFQVKRKN